MLISRMVAEICGSLMRLLDSFMISVDFWSDPVTLTIAIIDTISNGCNIKGILHVQHTQLLRELITNGS
jgi:hypothetical protein